MLVSYKWLEKLVDLKDITPEQLADKMSRSGIEVEDVAIPQEGLKKIVVGDVKECRPHGDSDHLSVCQIDVGEEELYQIVCGAPNIRAGKKVIVALPNSRITGNVKIKKGKMRGEVSLGMVCSLDELGYSTSVVPKAYADGIYFLPDEATPGDEVFSYLAMDDAIVELSITPNRADALSMRGVAHEVAAIYNRKVTFPVKELVEASDANISDYVSVDVENQEDTPTYRMRVIKDVTIKESPMWLQTLLMNEGIRPINNVVDVTNYVLLLFGQPQHAFDYDKLGSKEINVRRANDGEKLVTLDEEERELTTENLVITNGSDPIALAGVMGGFDSEITKNTTTVALETALFNSTLTRRTARGFGLSSESSKRFERGINVSTIEEASAFAAQMIAELSDGVVVSGEVISNDYHKKDVVVSITLDKINGSLGTDLSVRDVQSIFESLGFGSEETAETFVVSIPPRRWDISIEADLVEEVARIFGYDNLPSTLPKGSSVAGKLSRNQKVIRDIRRQLEGNGLTEAISYMLTTPELATKFVLDPKDVVALDLPMSEERSTARQSLVSGLLKNVAYNQARKNNQIAFYEIGNIFEQLEATGLPKETKHLSMALSGTWFGKTWDSPAEAVDFYTLKGIVEKLMELLDLEGDLRFNATKEYQELHPGRSADIYIGLEKVGFMGQVHPIFAKEMEINETYVCELDLDTLCELAKTEPTYQEVGKYPSIKRDIALLADTAIESQDIINVIVSKGGKYLVDIQLFDVFQNEKLGDHKKSLAYSLIFRNDEATLVDEEVTSVMEKVNTALLEQLNIEVR
ncbi:phenylalanine--tRNA ligase subunit beta [Vagococcus fluvialis]|uniref:Phenylalanine--tRNA ligase beta subunit n=1 Tax=Vagococcus fluvialis bH819 TaxID=1255619 RepID=A0A1X6WR82_9ENTE|nr:phenylalanine--tRNA ligase subunit beta [Vagococcus fluvialis]SLM86804.1 Phenylalanyl-tRNA synthetase beta chain [Vagococcus fluvialis bH819]